MFEKASEEGQWYKRLQKAKTAEEYIGIYAEKGIEFSNEQKEGISALFACKNEGRLKDEDLDGVAGGYIPFFDECRDSWNFYICMTSRSCSHLKRTKIETTASGKAFAYYTCTKGCFSSIKRDITNSDYV